MADSIVPYEQLIDLAEGRLSAEQAALLRARVADHPQTQRELVALEQLIGFMRSDHSVDPPAHVFNRALNLFRSAKAPGLLGQLRRCMATLRFDSVQAPLAMGLRTDSSAGRQLLYAAADRTIDLRISPERTIYRLSGQILGSDDPGTVELQSEGFSALAKLSELCEFVLPSVPPGRYTLFVRQGDEEIEIAGLEIQGI